MIQAVIFDFDGTILDTETPEFRAFHEIYEEHGQVLSVETWGLWVGTDSSQFNPYDHLEACTGQVLNREEIRHRRRMKYASLVAEETVKPGVEDYLRTAKALGLQVGLASSSPREWVINHLQQLNLLAYFDCIRVREDVARVKPSPELYLEVLEAFGLEPREAIAVEDSPNGARAAKAAGLRCVVVPNELTKQLRFDEVDVTLDSLADRSLPDLLEQFK